MNSARASMLKNSQNNQRIALVSQSKYSGLSRKINHRTRVHRFRKINQLFFRVLTLLDARRLDVYKLTTYVRERDTKRQAFSLLSWKIPGAAQAQIAQ